MDILREKRPDANIIRPLSSFQEVNGVLYLTSKMDRATASEVKKRAISFPEGLQIQGIAFFNEI